MWKSIVNLALYLNSDENKFVVYRKLFFMNCNYVKNRYLYRTYFVSKSKEAKTWDEAILVKSWKNEVHAKLKDLSTNLK